MTIPLKRSPLNWVVSEENRSQVEVKFSGNPSEIAFKYAPKYVPGGDVINHVVLFEFQFH